MGADDCRPDGISHIGVLGVGNFQDQAASQRRRHWPLGLSQGSVCCSVEDSALGLEPLHTQAVSTPADWTAPDGNGDQGLEAALSSAQTDPGIGDLEAARVAAPPQSRLRRMLSAFIDLGANR